MLEIIQNNPYRILGIFSNSPAKERVANNSRLQAFLKVGKDISFPLDLPGLLPKIDRTPEAVAEADSALALPSEQLRYAQFWFIKATPLDEVAINHLTAGNMTMAISIWEKKEDASSLQNQLICALIMGINSTALACAEKLYTNYVREFVTLVLGEHRTSDQELIAHNFIDELCTAIGINNILPYIQNNEWKQYAINKAAEPLIDNLYAAIEVANATKNKGITVRYNAGIKLKNETSNDLSKLKELLPPSDLRYQTIADKLGLAILQCGIDFFNDSKANDAARKAMSLNSYAGSIVVGKMARDRCKENMDILQKIIDNLPPSSVTAEDTAIKKALDEYCQFPDLIIYAVTLLNKTKPHLQSIKTKLGSSNSYYLRTSTEVVTKALNNLIEEVNSVQKTTGLDKIKHTVSEAWNATLIMDTFDMEADFKANRYAQNRAALKDICDHLGISSSTRSVSTPSPLQRAAMTLPEPITQLPYTPSPFEIEKPSAWESLRSCLSYILYGVGFLASLIICSSIGDALFSGIGGLIGAIIGPCVYIYLGIKVSEHFD